MTEYQNLKQAIHCLKEARAWLCISDEELTQEIESLISQVKEKMKVIEDQD